VATQVRPLEDRVIVKRIEEQGAEERGRHHRPRHGQGEAAGRKSDGSRVPVDGGRQGPDARREGRRPGTLFGKYAGTEIKLDGEEDLILREEDILDVIEG